jgi:hypothetical protein
MAKFYSELTKPLQQFIAEQHIFFTATAPTDGRVNLSPKGINTFRILNPQAIAYLDLTGSGNESSAHLIENGRMTIMFCSFQDAPLILRLYGRGQVIRPRDTAWQELSSLFPSLPGTRQIIQLAVEMVQTSCGTGVPLYDFVGDRTAIIDWATRKGEDGLRDYWYAKNQVSIDGLPTHLIDEPEC